MKLVAAGLGRTGTGSITMALEQLGLSTLSQETLFSNLQNHAHVNAVLRGESALDWSLFEGVDATLGWPLCFLYRELLGRFPEAKCLLNVRDPESWFDSISRSWETLRIVRSANFFPVFAISMKRLMISKSVLAVLQKRRDGLLPIRLMSNQLCGMFPLIA